jgi:hypothetical protein
LISINNTFEKVPEPLLFKVLNRYIKYNPKTRNFFSDFELKNLTSKKESYTESFQESQDKIINKYLDKGWKIEEQFEIKNCPCFFLKRKNDKIVIIMGIMDNKTYVYSQEFIKSSQSKEKKSDLKKSLKIDSASLIEYFHVIYIFYSNGTTIFEHRFKKDKYIDSDLLTSILTAIGEVLKEATGNLNSIQEINQGNLFIIFEHEKLFSTILVSEKNIPEIRDKLKIFNKKFLEAFKDNLINWTGEISKFNKTKGILEEVYEINIDEISKKSESETEINTQKEELITKTEKQENNMDVFKITGEELFYYYCENCSQWYKVNFRGKYSCLYCNSELVDMTDNVKKIKEKESLKDNLDE